MTCDFESHIPSSSLGGTFGLQRPITSAYSYTNSFDLKSKRAGSIPAVELTTVWLPYKKQ